MAYVQATALPHTAGSIFDLPSQILHRLHAWNMARQTRNALMQLTPRELADVGLTYADIEKVAQKVANA